MMLRFRFANRAMLIALACLGLHAARAPVAQADVWATLARRAAKVGDDLPMRQADEVIDQLRRSRGLQDTMNSRFARLGRAGDDLDEAARLAARRAAVRSALETATVGVDSRVLRSLDELDDIARETALVVAEGGQHTARVVPDLALRAGLLERGGIETMAGVGMFGEDAARAALRLDTAVQAGKLTAKGAARGVTVADFGRLLSRQGEAGWKFWSTYVTPHWGKWLTGGALAALLIAPEEFMDTTGKITEGGIKRLTELVGTTAAAAIRGVAEGGGAAATQIGQALRDSYLSGWRGLAALIGTVAFFAMVLPRPRRTLFGWFRRAAVGAAVEKKDAA
ncbi:MAG: hypothetical protein KDB14_09675 [Planctomycetales bacterium]|nr:hypothetical protein [Planctomycetales bacterium]